jgi:hypothetical protein
MERSRVRILLAIMLPLLFATPGIAKDRPAPPPPVRTPYYVPHLLDSVQDAAGKLQFLQPRIFSGGVAAQQLAVDQNGVNIAFSEHGVNQRTQYFWAWGGGYNAPVVTPYENHWTFSVSYAQIRGFFGYPREMGVSAKGSYQSLTLSTLDDVHMFLDALVTLTVASGNPDFFVFDFDWDQANAKISKKLKLPSVVVVTDIQAGGPADKAGLQEGDLITAVDGKPTSEIVASMHDGLKASPSGYTVHLSVVRNGAPVEVAIKYAALWPAEAVQMLQVRTAAMARAGGAQPSGPDAAGSSSALPAAPTGVKLGIRGHNITPDEAKSAGLTDVRGVMIDEVAANGIADNARVLAGDVLLEIDGAAAGTLDELKAVLLKGTPSRIKVWRKGAALSLLVAQSL